jgi:hypothetical protein
MGYLTTVYQLQWFVNNYRYEDDYALTSHSGLTAYTVMLLILMGLTIVPL